MTDDVEFQPITSIEHAVQFFGGEEEFLKYVNSVGPRLADEADAVVMEPLNPDPSPDPRAVMAEYMLDRYHLLKVNLKTREAIHRNLHDRGALAARTEEAYQMVVQAQAELDQCKYEILELMGVDS